MNITIETKSGPVAVDQELLNGYIDEAGRHYAKIDEAKGDLKLIGEALEEKTGIKAALLMKYAKAKYADSTEATTELGELFTQLDAATVA